MRALPLGVTGRTKWQLLTAFFLFLLLLLSDPDALLPLGVVVPSEVRAALGRCRQNIVATIKCFFLFLLLLSDPGLFLKRGFPRVLKLSMGSYLTKILLFHAKKKVFWEMSEGDICGKNFCWCQWGAERLLHVHRNVSEDPPSAPAGIIGLFSSYFWFSLFKEEMLELTTCCSVFSFIKFE